MFRRIDSARELVLKDYILIIPGVSVGNVPQLTVDLIITILKCEKVACIWHPAISAVISSDPYEQDEGIATACELYINDTLKLAVIQLRSTIETRLAQIFFQDFKDSLEKLKLREIVILASGFDYDLKTFTTNKFQYIKSDNTENDTMNDLKVTKCEDGRVPNNGVGFAGKLFSILRNDYKCTFIIKHVSEGDNRPDAVSMFELLLKSKFISNSENHCKDIKLPHCWNFIFGKESPVGIF